MSIKKSARFLYRSIKGNLSVPAIIEFLQTRGYDVVFFNTPEGDDLLRRYGIKLNGAGSVTYCGVTKVVFADDTLHISDKLYALLHECGHIMLGHLVENQIHSISKRITENEAEAFVYEVLHLHRRPKRIPALVAIVFLLVFLFFGALFAFRSRPEDSEQNPIVYVTQDGTHYHRKSCLYATNFKTSKMYKSEAEITLLPCSFCNP